MIDRRTGSARSVGPRRIRKSYLLSDGSTLMARSAAGARIDAARKGLTVIGLGSAGVPAPKAPPAAGVAGTGPDATARVIETDKVTVTAEPSARAQPKAVAKAGTQKAKKRTTRKKHK